MPDAFPILAFVTLQRIAELWFSARNTKRLRDRGAIEAGQGHYPLMVGLHAGWLAGLWILSWPLFANWWLVAAYLALQILRVWVIASLGERWMTRIFVLPGARIVSSGPYRLLRHPNYIVVVIEIALLPLAFGLVAFAIAFSVANAAVLAWRIRVEERALSSGSSHAA